MDLVAALFDRKRAAQQVCGLVAPLEVLQRRVLVDDFGRLINTRE
jgi:hypothetical protein